MAQTIPPVQQLAFHGVHTAGNSRKVNRLMGRIIRRVFGHGLLKLRNSQETQAQIVVAEGHSTIRGTYLRVGVTYTRYFAFGMRDGSRRNWRAPRRTGPGFGVAIARPRGARHSA